MKSPLAWSSQCSEWHGDIWRSSVKGKGTCWNFLSCLKSFPYARRPLQSLRLKIHRLPNFNMLFQHFNFFQKRTVCMFTVPIILLSRSLVSSSRVLFLASPPWTLIFGKPVEEVVILEKGKCLPSWVAGITVDVVVSVEKYLNCCSHRYIVII